MAEGPSILILKERAAVFIGQEIVRVEGDTPAPKERLLHQRIVGLRSHGKHFLIELAGFTLRVHLLMLGSYCIDQRKDKPIRLGLGFAAGREINFYSCSLKFVDAPLDRIYDWRIDVLAPQWDAAVVRKKLRALPTALVCDALLDQTVFAGVGNVIKNDILFRIRLHPLSVVGACRPPSCASWCCRRGATPSSSTLGRRPIPRATEPCGRATRWPRTGSSQQEDLPALRHPVAEGASGELDRRSFYCENCQVRYA